MTVGRLRAELSKFPDDMPVVMSKDAEGNGYSPLGGVWPAFYLADQTYSGEVLEDEDTWHPDNYDCDCATHAEHVKDADQVVLLGPVN